MMHPAGDDLADIPEQRLEIGREGIASLMQMPHHLVQIIPKPDELRVDQPLHIVFNPGFSRRLYFLIKKQGAPEMHGAHAERGRTLFDALQLACCEAYVQLLTAGF
jgi:hypothetical protein